MHTRASQIVDETRHGKRPVRKDARDGEQNAQEPGVDWQGDGQLADSPTSCFSCCDNRVGQDDVNQRVVAWQLKFGVNEGDELANKPTRRMSPNPMHTSKAAAAAQTQPEDAEVDV